MTLLIAEYKNLLRGIILVGEMSRFMAVGWDSWPSLGFLIKVQRKETVNTYWGQQCSIK